MKGEDDAFNSYGKTDVFGGIRVSCPTAMQCVIISVHNYVNMEEVQKCIEVGKGVTVLDGSYLECAPFYCDIFFRHRITFLL